MKKIMNFIYLVFSIQILSNAVLYAENKIPSPWDLGKIQYFDKEEKGVLNEANLTINGITIYKSKFVDVKGKFGQFKTFNFQPYSDFHTENKDQAICYISNKVNDDTLLMFQSENIDSVIYSISLGPKSILKDLISDCSKSDFIDNNIHTLSGVKLGISKQEFIKLVGEKYHMKGNTIYYNFTDKVMMSEKEKKEMEDIFKTHYSADEVFWFCSTGLYAYFLKDKLIWFSIDKSMTN